MSVLEMTRMSYFFIIMAASFGAAAVLLFFVYDIRRCWRIVSGKRIGSSAAKTSVNRQKKCIERPARQDRIQAFAPEEKTEALFPDAGRSTTLLTVEETQPLETMYLVQDITMMEMQS